MPPDNAPRTSITHDTVKMLLQGVLMPGEGGDEAAGDDLGMGFRLVERIGEGGFGVVWRAEQTVPVRREVAVKLVKLGMDSREVLARFEQERQMLAAMEHPCITQIFDAGLTPDGRPYFVMELVRGLPLTQHVACKKMPLRMRLELFTELCHGVHHAHQKGVIHRDLKPSNVLVAEVDGRPVPKIIDFGIAKALTGRKLTNLTLVTRTGTAMGTPLYMAPEQLADQEAVDTRSDVYALGALLYELLTDSPPFPVETLTANGEDEMRRIIREVAPQRPSRRLTAQKLPSDLDWITLRALEKDPRRRYASADDLAADVERFLAWEPVAAHPPEWTYLTGLWVTRHRAACVAILVSAVALVAGTALALWQADEARQERNAAREHEAAARRAEEDAVRQTALSVASEKQAQAAKRRAEQTVEFLSQLLDHAAEEVERGSNPEALTKALARSNGLLKKLQGDPTLQSGLLERVARLYGSIGDWSGAIESLHAYADVMGVEHGAESAEAHDARLDALRLVADHGERASVPAALEVLQARMEKAGLKGKKIWFDLLRERVRVWLKLDESQKALEVSEAMMAALPEWKVVGQTRLNTRLMHATALEYAGRYDEALLLLEVCRFTGIEEKAKESAMLSIEKRQILILEGRGDHAGGAAVLRRHVEEMRRAQPPAKLPDMMSTLLRLAGLESAAGQHDEALKDAQEALALARSPEADGSSATGSVCQCLISLASCESAAGLHEQALRHAQEGRAEALRSGRVRDLVPALEGLAWCHRAAGQLDGAFDVWEEAARAQANMPNFKSVFYPLVEMAAIRHEQGRHAEALGHVQDIWQRCVSHPLGAADIGELGYTAGIALKYWATLERAAPSTPPPAELTAWKKAVETERTQNSAKGHAPADKGSGRAERVGNRSR